MNYDELISSEVSVNDVCGVNLEDDSGFQNFFFESEGTPERFDGQTTTPAEPPDWRSVKKNALTFLEKTHDLKLISILSQAVLNTEGIIKFEECLRGLAKLISNHWKELYPPLDEDDGDPMERISALGHLTDKAFIINVLKTTPIINSKVLGNISLQLIDRAADPSTKKTDADLEITQVKGGFKDSNSDELLATYNATTQCVSHLNTIDQAFIENASNEYNVNFDVTIEVLTHLAATIKKYGNISTEVVETSTDISDTTSSAVNNDTPTVNQNISSEPKMNNQAFDSSNMKLSSRQDVERCFDLICAYYEEFEPSSPIPILIKRSQKLVNLDFLEIVKDIFPDALDQVHKLGGISESDAETDKESSSSSSGSSW
ncbi:type VI secretion system protein TssA [Colwellia sp. E150_009]